MLYSMREDYFLCTLMHGCLYLWSSYYIEAFLSEDDKAELQTIHNIRWGNGNWKGSFLELLHSRVVLTIGRLKFFWLQEGLSYWDRFSLNSTECRPTLSRHYFGKTWMKMLEWKWWFTDLSNNQLQQSSAHNLRNSVFDKFWKGRERPPSL